MQTVRFFENREGRGGTRQLLIGIATCEDSWEVDGGRREAVELANAEDAVRYPAAYAAYRALWGVKPEAMPETAEPRPPEATQGGGLAARE
jgi:hypothetical protein